MFLKTLGLMTISVMLTACNITGSAQKGPFKNGSAVSSSPIDNQGNAVSSSTINTDVYGSQGTFSVDRIPWSGWTELVVTGQYFDEFSNVDSDQAITLNAITRKDRKYDKANVNLFTHLAAARIRQLLGNGQNRNNAWRNAQTDLTNVFGLSRVSRNFHRGVEQLSLLNGSGYFRKDNANLLLFTGAFLSESGDETGLLQLTDDFADDGVINGIGLNLFSQIAIKANTNGLLDTLSNNLKSIGVSNPPNSRDLINLPSWVNSDVVDPNNAPVAIDQTISFDEDSNNNVITLSASDADGDVLSFTNTDTSNGTLGGEAPNLTYTPDANFFGTDSFSFTVTDGSDSDTATVTINVVDIAEPNTAPVALSLSITFGEDTSNNVITLSATDADGDVLSFSNTNPSNGTLDGEGANLTYTPNANFFGTDSFDFTVSDGLDETTATISITVSQVNDTPVIESQNISVLEDSVDNTITLESTDADGDQVSYNFTAPSNGTLTGSSPNLLYTPNANFFGTDSFTYTASDSNNTTSEEATVTINVSAVNDAPVADAQVITILEDSVDNEITLTARDVENEELTYQVSTGPSNGSLGGMAPNLTYTPNADFFGSDSLEFTVSDGVDSSTATVNITVKDVADLSEVNLRVSTPSGEVLNGVNIVAQFSENDDTSSFSTNTLGNSTLELAANLEYVLKLDLNGYATQVLPIKAPVTDEQISLDVTMTERGATQTFNGAVGGLIIGDNGASVIVEPNSFVDSSGSLIAGDITVTITPVDVSNPSSLAAFPGEFIGIQEDSSQTPIISLGTVEYKFFSNGEEVQLADNVTADILIPVYIPTYQNGSAVQVGDVIPLWSLNEVTGIWLQEGAGVIEASTESPTGLAMRATVDHFTWWNCDVSMDAGIANVTVTSPDASTGTAILTGSVAESCDIGWRSSVVSSSVSIGNSISLDIPSDCEVCYQARWSSVQAGEVLSDVQCATSDPNDSVIVNLTLATTGPLDIVANGIDGSVNVNAAIGFASERIRLSPATLESSVSYSVVSGQLPLGLSLNVINTTQAEIVGVPTETGNFSIVIQGNVAGEVDTVTINYNIIDPLNTDLPVFINDPIYISFDNFFGPIFLARCDLLDEICDIDGPEPNNTFDLNSYNVGGEATSWSLEQDNDAFFVGQIPDWIGFTSDGFITFNQTDQSSGQWTGILKATNVAGSVTTSMVVCFGGDCVRTSPLPGEPTEGLEIRFRSNPITRFVGSDPGTFIFEDFSFAVLDGVYLNGEFISDNVNCNFDVIDFSTVGSYDMQCTANSGLLTTSNILTVNIINRPLQ